jgi:hypothetical protein
MSMNKALIAVSVFFLVCSPVFSQQGRSSIHFENEQHNFGVVNEADGMLKHDFVFTNRGEDPLVVTNVRAGGGITVTGWTRSPVMTGETGTITVEFNPVNMHGAFNRSFSVNATGNPSSKLLRLLGEVVPREKTPEELYPRETGNLRLRSNHISFGHVSPGSVRKDSLEIINLSDGEVDLSYSNVPGHIGLRTVPSRLKPGEKGFIIATFNAGQVNEWGIVTNSFRVLVNGESKGNNIIYLSVNIQEDFSKLSKEEREKAPAITFENRVLDFGSIRQGESVEHDFAFSNTGKSDLVIRRVRSGCGCTATEPQKTLLRPGESSSIKAVFNSGGFSGRQSKTITVISNDPADPNIILRITGEIATDEEGE